MQKLNSKRNDALPLVRTLKKGEKITYHQGFLAIDRGTEPGLRAIAKEFGQLAEKGLVALTQQRVGPREMGQFNYIATGL